MRWRRLLRPLVGKLPAELRPVAHTLLDEGWPDTHARHTGDVPSGARLRSLNCIEGDLAAGAEAQVVNAMRGAVSGELQGVNLVVGPLQGGSVDAVNLYVGPVHAGEIRHANVVVGDVHGGRLWRVNVLVGDIHGGEISDLHLHLGRDLRQG